MRNIFRGIAIIILVIGLPFLGYRISLHLKRGLDVKQAVVESKDKQENIKVIVRKIRKQKITNQKSFMGIVDQNYTKVLAPGSNPKLQYINQSSPEGYYKKGTVLCKFDSGILEHEKNKINAELDYAEKQLARLTELQKTGSVSTAQLDEIISKQKTLSEELMKIQNEIEKYIIRAPYDCVINITNISLEKGSDLAPHQEIMTIYNKTKTFIDVKLPFNEKEFVLKSDCFVVFGNYETEVKIINIAPNVQPTSNSVSLRLESPLIESLAVGQPLEVIFRSKEPEEAVVLEEEAVQVRDMKSYVFVIKKGLACKVNVHTEKLPGEINKLKVFGLKDKDIVVISGADKLHDVSRVRIQEEE